MPSTTYPVKPDKWIGFDFDCTLAAHVHGESLNVLGKPILVNVLRVKKLLAMGWKVKIFTARVSSLHMDAEQQRQRVQLWCSAHIGQVLEVTAEKDDLMEELWDDRAVAVEANSGRRLTHSRLFQDCDVCGYPEGHEIDCWKAAWLE